MSGLGVLRLFPQEVHPGGHLVLPRCLVVVASLVAEKVGACALLLHEPFHLADSILEAGIVLLLDRAPREEDARVGVDGGLGDVGTELGHGGLDGGRNDGGLREDVVEADDGIERHHAAHRIAGDGGCLAVGPGAIVLVDEGLEAVLDPLERLMADTGDVAVEAALDIVGTVFADACPVVLGAFDAHHDEAFPPAVEKLLEAQAPAEGGIAVEVEVVAVEHVEDGIALGGLVVVVGQIKVDAAVFAGRFAEDVEFLYHVARLSFFVHKADELVLLFDGPETDGVHLVAHGAREDVGHPFAHDQAVGIAFEDLLVGVDVVVDVAARGKDAVVFVEPCLAEGVACIVLAVLSEARPAEGHHVGPDSIDVGGVGVVDHVGRVATCGAHVDLERHEVAHFAQIPAGLVETEELEVDEAVDDAEGLHRVASQGAEGLGHLLVHVVGEVEALVDDVHDAGRPDGHRLEQGLAFGIDDGFVGTDFARDELLDDVGLVAVCLDEGAQLLFVVQLVGAACPNAHIGLGDERIATFAGKAQQGIQPAGGLLLPCCGNAALAIVLLHLGLLLDGGDEACVLFEPVFVVGLYPVDLAIFVGEEGHGTEHLAVVLHVFDTVVFGEGVAEFGAQRFVGRIGNAKHMGGNGS